MHYNIINDINIFVTMIKLFTEKEIFMACLDRVDVGKQLY